MANLPFGVNLTETPFLPGEAPRNKPLPHVPAFWADANRVVSDVLKLWEQDPEAAQELWAWVKMKLRPTDGATGSSGSSGSSGVNESAGTSGSSAGA